MQAKIISFWKNFQKILCFISWKTWSDTSEKLVDVEKNIFVILSCATMKKVSNEKPKAFP